MDSVHSLLCTWFTALTLVLVTEVHSWQAVSGLLGRAVASLVHLASNVSTAVAHLWARDAAGSAANRKRERAPPWQSGHGRDAKKIENSQRPL